MTVTGSECDRARHGIAFRSRINFSRGPSNIHISPSNGPHNFRKCAPPDVFRSEVPRRIFLAPSRHPEHRASSKHLTKWQTARLECVVQRESSRELKFVAIYRLLSVQITPMRLPVAPPPLSVMPLALLSRAGLNSIRRLARQQKHGNREHAEYLYSVNR